MAEVRVIDLVKRFGSVPIIHGISLTVSDHEFMALVGPSGCGKSTTLRVIAGLEAASGGDIHVAGRRVNDVEPSERNVAMVFQGYALYPHMNVFDNMSFSLKVAGLSRSVREERVREAAAILQLEPYLNRRPADLSGGQRQRVAMGRAIVRRPGVFLFDEPLSNLDAKLRTEMRTEIKRIHAEVGATTIYVTHDQVEAMTLGDRIVILRDGAIEQIGTPYEIYETPSNAFVASFFGSPPMNLAEAEVEDGELVLDGGARLPLGQAHRALVTAGERLTVGLRADDIAPAGHGLDVSNGHRWQVNAVLAEPLGSESLVLFDHAGASQWFSKMLKPRPVQPGEPLELTLDVDKLHLFRGRSGERVQSANRSGPGADRR